MLLIDGDILLYKTLNSVEHEVKWENDIWTLHVDPLEAHCRIIQLITEIKDQVKIGKSYNVIIALSSLSNFRKTLLPSYKSNRKGKRKPLYYKGLIEWLNEHYPCMTCKNLEADDVLGILATMYEAMTGELAIVATIDKDLKSIPCLYYNIDDKTTTTVSVDQADYYHKYQTLVGDSTDNYKGCPKVGDKNAKRILEADDSWDNIKEQFRKANADFTVQSQVARIARVTDYDFKNKEIKPWKI